MGKWELRSSLPGNLHIPILARQIRFSNFSYDQEQDPMASLGMSSLSLTHCLFLSTFFLLCLLGGGVM
jgi:hypothetical protein